MISIVDGNIQLVLLYCSSRCNFPEVVLDLHQILSKEKTNLITGDFNFETNEKNPITKYLQDNQFVQLVKNCTSDKGRTIDLCYVPAEVKDKVEIKQYSPFYTDHDALCISLKNN